jgi:membrane-associated phospholipid phosphatase
MGKVLLIAVALLSSHLGQAQHVDIDLLRRINVERNAQLDGTYRLITQTSTPLAFAVPFTTLTVGLIQKDSTQKVNALHMFGAVAINLAATTSMKYLFNRDRPFETYSDIIQLTKAPTPSFPSGHTSIAFTAATSLSLSYPKWYVIAPSFLWASAVGYSRMHLGVHYPSDVLVGAFVGAGSAWLSTVLTRKWLQRRDKVGLRL